MLRVLEMGHAPVDHPSPRLGLPWHMLAATAWFAQTWHATTSRYGTDMHQENHSHTPWWDTSDLDKATGSQQILQDLLLLMGYTWLCGQTLLCSRMHQSKPGAVSLASTDLPEIYTHSSISPTQKVTKMTKNGHIHFLNAAFGQKTCPKNFF